MALIRYKTGMCCVSILLVLMSVPCIAGQREFSFVNPVWKGILGQQVPRVLSRPSGTFQAYQGTVSSYDDFRLVLIRALRSRQSDVTIYFDPYRSEDECKDWNDRFWGPSSSPEPTDSDLFQKIPWLYWAWTKIVYEWHNDQWSVTKIEYTISYRYGPDKEKALERGLVRTLDQIVSPDMDMFTREKAIHDWIVNHVDYDKATLNGSDDMGYTDYSAFTRGLAVCEGYSVLTDRMLSMAGIPDLIVVGSAGGGDHQWNMVNLCGNWYDLDVTWDDHGSYGDHTIHYDYFDISDGQMSVDHIWDRGAYPAAPQAFNENMCQGKIGHRCSIFEPGLCDTELECIRISGTWRSGQCIEGAVNGCLRVSPEELSLTVGRSQAVRASGGIAPYRAASSDEGVAEVSVSGDTVTVTGVATGRCTISISDSSSPIQTICISVLVRGQPIPSGRHIVELTGSARANARVNLGSIVNGGDQMQLDLNFPAYEAAVDEYVAVQIPDGRLLFVSRDKTLTTDMVAYATGVTDATRIEVFSAFEVCSPSGASIPTGTWTVYSLVVPSNGGDFNSINWTDYDLQYYTFDVFCH